MSVDFGKPVIKTLLLLDFVGSTRFVEQLGDSRSSQIFTKLDRLARDLLLKFHGQEIDKTDGFLFIFDRPIDAVHYALSYHSALKDVVDGLDTPVSLTARAGVHLGEVILREINQEYVDRGAKPVELEGLAKPTVGRIGALAGGGQTLLTQSAFELARRASVGDDNTPEQTQWLEHGEYLLKGIDDPIKVYEVGVAGVAPLTPPANSEKARRVAWTSEQASSSTGSRAMQMVLGVAVLMVGVVLVMLSMGTSGDSEPAPTVETASELGSGGADGNSPEALTAAEKPSEPAASPEKGASSGGSAAVVKTPAMSRLLTINSKPAGADIFHNDALVGVTPVVITLAPTQTSYLIRAQLKDHKATETACRLSPDGGPSTCLVQLPPFPAATTNNVAVEPGKKSGAASRRAKPVKKEQPAAEATPKPKEQPKEKPKIHMIDE